MSVIDQIILEKVAHLNESQKTRLLEYIENMDFPESSTPQVYSLDELMQLPFEQRNRLAIEALERSQDQDIEVLDVVDEADFDDE